MFEVVSYFCSPEESSSASLNPISVWCARPRCFLGLGIGVMNSALRRPGSLRRMSVRIQFPVLGRGVVRPVEDRLIEERVGHRGAGDESTRR
jgi:hypothetical protein